MRKSHDKQDVFRENVIHVGAGFVAKERPHVLEALSTLGPHLGRWDPSQVDIDVTLQDRGGKEQRVTHCGRRCPAVRSSWRSLTTRTSLALSAMQSVS